MYMLVYKKIDYDYVVLYIQNNLEICSLEMENRRRTLRGCSRTERGLKRLLWNTM